jgi:hypothetical protein
MTSTFSGKNKRGTYVCEICGKTTRETDADAAQFGYCEHCFLECEITNYISDESLDEHTVTEEEAMEANNIEKFNGKYRNKR